MKISTSLLALLFTAATGQIRAQTQIGGGLCANSIFSGTYFYLLTGSVASGAAIIPYSELGKLVADGKGGVSGQSKASLNGVQTSYALNGNYSVQPNCTGNISLRVNSSGTSNLTFQVSNGGKGAVLAASSAGAVVVGRAYPVSDGGLNEAACANASLSGSYAYLLSGYVMAANSTLLYADDGQVAGDGVGSLSVSSTANLGGLITPATGAGAYSIASDCSGSARVSNSNGTVNYAFAVVEDGQTLLFMGSDAGYVVAGVAQPQFTAPQNAIVNSGSFTPGRLSAGSLFSIFGKALSSQAASAQSLPLPRTLGNTQVLVNGSPAPLFFVSPGQINAQLPFEVQAGNSVSISVSTEGGKSNTALLAPLPAAPGIFTYGNSHAVVQNPDGSINSPATPAHAEDVLVAYLTGGGPVSAVPGLQTGEASPNALLRVTSDFSITLGAQNADVLYLGLTPSLVGVYQANLKVPSIEPGDYHLVVTINGVVSNAAVVSIGN